MCSRFSSFAVGSTKVGPGSAAEADAPKPTTAAHSAAVVPAIGLTMSAS